MRLQMIYSDESNAIVRDLDTRQIHCVVDENDNGVFDFTNLQNGFIDDRITDLDTFDNYWEDSHSLRPYK